jgi:hypothetical protein
MVVVVAVAHMVVHLDKAVKVVVVLVAKIALTEQLELPTLAVVAEELEVVLADQEVLAEVAL